MTQCIVPFMSDRSSNPPGDTKALQRWNNEGGAQKKGDRSRKRPRDANKLAKRVVEIATGEASNEPARKKPAKGRAGGLKGGAARASALGPQTRREIARKAASARWAKKQP